MILSDYTLRTAVEAYGKFGGNMTQAAKELGLPRTTLQGQLKIAAQKGLVGTVADWNVRPPPGYLMKGVSTYIDKDGLVAGQWVKTSQDLSPQDYAEVVKEALLSVTGKALDIAVPKALDAHLCTVYPLADLHFGMYSWSPETGEDYDLEIAGSLVRNAFGEMVALTPPSAYAVLLNLGDFFHSDSNENRTRRSGHALDVDTRYAKVLRDGVRLVVDVIDTLRMKHRNVLVVNLGGNHDPYGSLALTTALEAYYRKDGRVVVDTSPSPFWFWKWGRVLLGATHGDMAKAEDMAGIMASKVPQLWGGTDHRYVYIGHWHQNKQLSLFEKAGAQIEVFNTLAPKDAWNNAMGFTSSRSLQAIIHHQENGEVLRITRKVRRGS